LAATASFGPSESKIIAVENGLLKGISASEPDRRGSNIIERMKDHHVPGVSLAVVHHGEIVWTKGYGVLEAGSERKVEQATPFQTGSVGKMIAAMTVLSLVNKGILNLDEDVRRYLKSWKMPSNEFTERSEVTLRQLLSHTAGVEDDDSAPFAMDTPLPSLSEHLNIHNYEIIKTPGEGYYYSGAGYIIIEQIIEDVTGKPYQQVAAEELLKPLAMDHTFFRIKLSDGLAAKAASAHHANGERYQDRYPIYPCFAPGTCNWSTAEDLAKLFIEIHKSYYGKSNKVLPQSLVKSMVTGLSPAYGLGIKVIEDGPETLIGHSGDFYGFHACVYGYLESGNGVAVMTNGDDGVALYNEIVRSVSKAYDWTGCKQEIASALRWEDIDIRDLCGTYFMPGKLDIMNIYEKDGKLSCDVLGETGGELMPVNSLRFYESRTDGTISFKLGADGRVQSTEYRRIGVRLPCYPLPGFDLLLTERYEEGNRIILRSKKEYSRKRYFENVFNSLGYALMESRKLGNAINVFQLALKIYPKSANLYDSLGEAYMKNGEIRPAIESYKKSLELNPKKQNAKSMLERL